MNILIVDDVAENVCLLEALFEGKGYGIISANNGRQALERLRNAPVDLIVSDILMPVMDGFQLCRECKTSPQWREIPFVFYTATYTEKKDEEFALALGADRFVIKPQEPERFLEIMKEVLDISAVRRKAAVPALDDPSYLAAHSERVARKLEKKIADMAKLNLALRESEKKYRLLAENIQDVIFVLDLDLNYTYVSPSVKFLRGYAPEEVLKQPVSETVTPASWGRIVKTVSEATALEKSGQGDSQRSHTLLLEMLHRDGTAVWTEVRASFIRDENNRPAGILGVTRDITERKLAEAEREKLQAQLNHAQKLESVGRLAGGVAHDFNNMLTIISGYAEMARMKSSPQDPIHNDLEEILSAANRSADIVQQLLIFARKQIVAPKVLDLNETVGGMLKMLRRLIGEDIDLAWSPGKDLWPVKMDPSQIDQILANLCVNARDAISGIGKVTIETGNVSFNAAYCADHAGFSPGDFVLLAVSDDGSGMAKETLEHLFEPFFTTKEVGKGTGLGLATVHGIVKQNEGFINVYSEPGKGTTFRLYLNRHAGQAGEVPLKTDGEIPKGRGETVLLVEDEPVLLNLGTKMLEELGYRVLAAGTPSMAIHLAEERGDEIHLLMTDVIMPEMNGRVLAERLQILYPGLKRLFMSGYTADVIAHRGVLDPGVHFMQKPFSMEDVAFYVRKALND